MKNKTKWIQVNGAKMEAIFFEENLKEAKSYTWTLNSLPQTTDHVHCIICTIAIDTKDPTIVAYDSNGGWVCKHCFDAYLNLG